MNTLHLPEIMTTQSIPITLKRHPCWINTSQANHNQNPAWAVSHPKHPLPLG
jgi:hypothetical protein